MTKPKPNRVRSKVGRGGVSKAKWVNAGGDDRLRELHGKNMMDRDIAEKMGLAQSCISAHRLLLGLAPCGRAGKKNGVYDDGRKTLPPISERGATIIPVRVPLNVYDMIKKHFKDRYDYSEKQQFMRIDGKRVMLGQAVGIMNEELQAKGEQTLFTRRKEIYKPEANL